MALRQHMKPSWYTPPPQWMRKAPATSLRRLSWQRARRHWYLPRRGA